MQEITISMKRIYFIFFTIIFCFPTIAQEPTDSIKNKYSHYLQSKIQDFNTSLDSLSQSFSTWKYSKEDTLSNPYYYPLFFSSTLQNTTLQRNLGSLNRSSKYNLLSGQTSHLLSNIDAYLLSAYTSTPGTFQYNSAIEKSSGIRKDINKEVKADVRLSEKVSTVATQPIPKITEESIDIVVQKPNFWEFKSDFSLKFTQNHVSDNWYKGGESNYSFLTAVNLEANYNNKQKILFTNKLEMKLGFMSSKNDALHKFKTNDDLLRLTNKLGLKATKHWYYTVMLQSWTQFHPAYKSNDKKIYSDFMSPFESVFSLGMDYKLSLKKFSCNATLSPFACSFKYVDRKALCTSFGLKEGKHSKFNYGSNITANYTWNMFKNVTWKGRIYFFTDYSKAQIEWENTFNLRINKFLSTTLFLYPRFDDSVKRQKGESYIQFTELLSFGIDLSF